MSLHRSIDAFEAFFLKIYKNAALACLVFFGIWGIAFTFVMPPFQAPDEIWHWISANDRAEKILMGRKPHNCSVTVALPNYFGAHALPFHSEIKIRQSKFANAEKIKPECIGDMIGYGNAFSYPGVILSKFLISGENSNGRTALLSYYFARLLHGLMIGLALFRLLQLGSLRSTTPMPGTLSVLLISLSPLFVQQSFAVTSDLACNALAISLATWLLFFEKMKRFDVLLLTVVGYFACSTKPILLPALLPFYFAGVLNFLSNKSKSSLRDLIKAKISLLGLGSILLLTIVCFFNILSHSSLLTTIKEGIDPQKQLAIFLGNPIRELAKFTQGIETFTTLEFLASPLGWLDTYLSSSTLTVWKNLYTAGLILDFAFGILITWLTMSHTHYSQKLKWIGRRLLVALVACIGVLGAVFANMMTLYLTWTPVGHHEILGLQPRYFIFPWILLTAALGVIFSPPALLSEVPGERLFNNSGAIQVDVITTGLLAGTLAIYGVQIFLDIAARYY